MSPAEIPTVKPRSKVYSKAMKLLRERPRYMTLKVISADTGIPVGWLRSIIANPDLSPSVDRIELLLEYLDGKPLNL